MWVLRFVSILYFVSATWCLVNPELAAGFVGYDLKPNGIAEFFTVYGGLQMGIAWAMMLSSFKQDYIVAAVFFSAVMSCVLAGFRIISMGIYGFSDDVIAMAVLELVLAIILVASYYRMETTKDNSPDVLNLS